MTYIDCLFREGLVPELLKKEMMMMAAAAVRGDLFITWKALKRMLNKWKLMIPKKKNEEAANEYHLKSFSASDAYTWVNIQCLLKFEVNQMLYNKWRWKVPQGEH